MACNIFRNMMEINYKGILRRTLRKRFVGKFVQQYFKSRGQMVKPRRVSYEMIMDAIKQKFINKVIGRVNRLEFFKDHFSMGKYVLNIFKEMASINQKGILMRVVKHRLLKLSMDAY
jgi:hypothetical protein